MQHRLTRRFWARAMFLSALAAFAVFGVVAGFGLGPGPLLGSIILAIYDLKRHERIPTLGYLLLVAALPVVAYVTLLVAWAREGR